ncbi:MAG: VacJ family lipoprotein [Halorhodospira halophila]|uniref:MlaA family lipoprotein n=1 Tax=Halorhodospira TaxID=85108 RepID=UPI001EE8855C|nr:MULTISPECIES: VacJ family lipoprotein [Halorhodospira]MCC3751917.1 VacJ family lipoprotein [Halorhodospira halophila]MCG5533325.1 VacJ family lipoprotein [Halorhodospira sp. 9621]MCG5537838.1 VacJ family lipoprotein [Halorhodospira sp. 9622]MCG5540696.1 VacJ family lipoprotein [Halorhodospira sp. M39old]MCG5545977.1 VacJ family lipoprotein [Halorhodospira sp. M38]
MRRGLLHGALLLALLPLLGACASSGDSGNPNGEDEWATEDEAWDDDDWGAYDDWDQGTWDPLEGFNRRVHAFNEVADRYAIRPVAVAYRDTVPSGVRRPISNFLNNLREPFHAGNQLLQGRASAGTRSVTRFAINSTIGVLGLFDVAGAAGLERERSDLGLTLGHWGAPEGPYLVLPLLGPSTARDSSGLAAQYFSREYHSPTHWADIPSPERYTVPIIAGIDTRVALLSLDELMAETGTDSYIFMRESYLQNRRERLGEDDWGDWDDDDWENGDWDDEDWDEEEDW